MNCASCKRLFSVHPIEQSILHKLSENAVKLFGTGRFPEPTLCPDCRQQRRLAMRNQRVLYQRSCDSCGKRMVGLYPSNSTRTVFCPACYWGDGWDAREFAQEFDPTREFFSQLYALWQSVPKIGLMILGENENSDYTNDNYKLKNCYLVFDGEQSIDCCYGETFSHLKNCFDFLCLQHAELCYQCTNCSECYELLFSQYCHNCQSSYFLSDCIGCQECFGCCNLVNKRHHFFNEACSPDEYRERLKNLHLGSHRSLREIAERVQLFFDSQPKRALRGVRNEDVVGDNINNSKDCFECYDCNECRDCVWSTNIMMGAQDSLDHNMWGDNTTLVYNSAAVGNGGNNIVCGYYVFSSVDSVYYSLMCSRGCKNLFGCVGLRHSENAILNTNYSASEYRTKAKAIVEQLLDLKLWGEYFPRYFPDFGYNETVAQEYFPLTKEEAVRSGFQWTDTLPTTLGSGEISSPELPDCIDETTDAVLSTVVRCERSGRLFRYTKLELDFCRRYGIALPRVHPDIRHSTRLQARNPRKAILRECSRCENEVTSTHPTSGDVLCLSCYEKEFRA